jgi:hypothetical protein
LKTKAYASTVDTMQELWSQIQQFGSEIKSTPGISERLRVSVSVDKNGGYFKHLLYERKNK